MKKYETSDIWIASALYSLGHTCSVEKIGELLNGRGKFVFIFRPETPEEEEQLDIRLEKYNRNNLEVDVSTLQSSYKRLKNLTF